MNPDKEFRRFYIDLCVSVCLKAGVYDVVSADPDVNLTLRHISDGAGQHFPPLRHTTHLTNVQISVGGKTTSLGDHETEEEAARAFDRAAINRSGCAEATTNFNVTEYAAEMDQLICALLTSCLYSSSDSWSPPTAFEAFTRI